MWGPTTFSARPAVLSAAPWTSTTAGDRIRALTAPHPIKPTSTNCHSAWQPNPGRDSTYRSGKPVQTTGTTSLVALLKAHNLPILKILIAFQWHRYTPAN